MFSYLQIPVIIWEYSFAKISKGFALLDSFFFIYCGGNLSDLFFQNDPIGSERQGETDVMLRWVRVEQQHFLTRRLHNDSVTTTRIEVPFSSFIWGWGWSSVSE